MSGPDIVTNMVNEMRLTPERAEFLQQQQNQLNNSGNFQQMTPEMQMKMMQMASQPQQQQPPPPQYDSDTASTSTQSTVSEDNNNKHTQSTFDNIMNYLRTPLIIAVLFIIFNLIQVDGLIKQLMPAIIKNSMYYYLSVKGLLVGGSYLLTRLVIEE